MQPDVSTVNQSSD